MHSVGSCQHRFCMSCLDSHIQTQLKGKCYPIPCPQPSCMNSISYKECSLLLSSRQDKQLLDQVSTSVTGNASCPSLHPGCRLQYACCNTRNAKPFVLLSSLSFCAIRACIAYALCCLSEVLRFLTSPGEFFVPPWVCDKWGCTFSMCTRSAVLLLLLWPVCRLSHGLPATMLWYTHVCDCDMMYLYHVGGSRGINTSSIQSLLPQPSLQHAPIERR